MAILSCFRFSAGDHLGFQFSGTNPIVFDYDSFCLSYELVRYFGHWFWFYPGDQVGLDLLSDTEGCRTYSYKIDYVDGKLYGETYMEFPKILKSKLCLKSDS